MFVSAVICFFFKGESRLAELDDQEEKREDQKKEDPNPRRRTKKSQNFSLSNTVSTKSIP